MHKEQEDSLAGSSNAQSSTTNDAKKPQAPFLLTPQDLETLSQTDEVFQPHTWSDLRHMISANDYARVKRFPSQLRTYIAWSNAINADPRYGSSTAYIKKELLHWDDDDLRDLADQMNPLTDVRDYRILLTEWPYALEPGVRHFLVWMKHFLEVDGEGSLTRESWDVVDGFVGKLFRERARKWLESRDWRGQPGLGSEGTERGIEELDMVLWGKAQKKFNTVPGIEHFHVWVRGMPDEEVQSWVWPGA